MPTLQFDQWFGSGEQIEQALKASQADTDSEGLWLVRGPKAPLIYGNYEDILITRDIEYRQDGDQWKSLVDLLVRIHGPRTLNA